MKILLVDDERTEREGIRFLIEKLIREQSVSGQRKKQLTIY